MFFAHPSSTLTSLIHIVSHEQQPVYQNDQYKQGKKKLWGLPDCSTPFHTVQIARSKTLDVAVFSEPRTVRAQFRGYTVTASRGDAEREIFFLPTAAQCLIERNYSTRAKRKMHKKKESETEKKKPLLSTDNP